MVSYFFRYVSLLFIFYSCAPNKLIDKQKQIKLIKAFKQNWTAGIEKGGSGVDYTFELIINTNQNISFDSIWINNKAFKLITTKRRIFISNEPITFSKGDTLLLKSSELTNALSQNIITYPPIENNGAALIGYYLKKKRRYLVVKTIETRPSVYYQ
jgi:hypothetical protein